MAESCQAKDTLPRFVRLKMEQNILKLHGGSPDAEPQTVWFSNVMLMVVSVLLFIVANKAVDE